MRQPQTSIMIPAYNEGDRVLDTVRGIVAAGEYGEIIVAFDGDVDTPAAELRRLGPEIYTITRPANLGCARNKNAAALTARGDYFIFLDAHSEVEPGWLNPLVAAAAESGISAGALKYRSEETGEIVDECMLGRQWTISALPWDVGAWPDPVLPVSYGACQCIRRDVFDRIGGFGGVFTPIAGEDMELSLKAWRFGYETLGVLPARITTLCKAERPKSERGEVIWANFARIGTVHWPPRMQLRMWDSAGRDWQQWPSLFDRVFTLAHSSETAAYAEWVADHALRSTEEFFERFPLLEVGNEQVA